MVSSGKGSRMTAAAVPRGLALRSRCESARIHLMFCDSLYNIVTG